jgi:hypothetical protein
MQRHTPEAAATGLDLFAAAWLERWNSYGGTVTVLENGSAMTGSFLPEQTGPHADWERGRHVGATRELLDLLDLVPGGKQAVAAHVKAFPVGAGNGMVFA